MSEKRLNRHCSKRTKQSYQKVVRLSHSNANTKQITLSSISAIRNSLPWYRNTPVPEYSSIPREIRMQNNVILHDIRHNKQIARLTHKRGDYFYKLRTERTCLKALAGRHFNPFTRTGQRELWYVYYRILPVLIRKLEHPEDNYVLKCLEQTIFMSLQIWRFSRYGSRGPGPVYRLDGWHLGRLSPIPERYSPEVLSY